MTKDTKVRCVEAIPIFHREPTDHNRFRSVCLVKITGEDGQVGWGECCSYFAEASLAAAKIWTAPIEWSGLKVSAWWASGPSERWFPARVGGIPRRCVA